MVKVTRRCGMGTLKFGRDGPRLRAQVHRRLVHLAPGDSGEIEEVLDEVCHVTGSPRGGVPGSA